MLRLMDSGVSWMVRALLLHRSQSSMIQYDAVLCAACRCLLKAVKMVTYFMVCSVIQKMTKYAGLLYSDLCLGLGLAAYDLGL